MITALAIMIAIAGYLQFAGTNLEKEYLTSDNTEDLSAVDSTDIVTDIESLVRMWRSSWRIIWMRICRWRRQHRTRGRSLARRY